MTTNNCPHNEDNFCMITTNLIGEPVPIDEQACRVCTERADGQQMNRVTCGRAVYILNQKGEEIPADILDCALGQTEGVGTELQKRIKWFVGSAKTKKCRRCMTRVRQMNKWGPDLCEKNMDRILRWLKHSAMKNKYPFSKHLVSIVVKSAIHAIRTSENEMGSSSNNRTS